MLYYIMSYHVPRGCEGQAEVHAVSVGVGLRAPAEPPALGRGAAMGHLTCVISTFVEIMTINNVRLCFMKSYKIFQSPLCRYR